MPRKTVALETRSSTSEEASMRPRPDAAENVAIAQAGRFPHRMLQ